MLEIADPAVLYFHRKGWASAMRDDLALHVAQEGEGAPVPDVPGTCRPRWCSSIFTGSPRSRRRWATSPPPRSWSGSRTSFAPLGTRSFKGLVDDIEIFEAQHSSDPSREKLADPVCDMELALEEVAARLESGGRTQMFCSSECLQLFVANPERYSPTQ